VHPLNKASGLTKASNKDRRMDPTSHPRRTNVYHRVWAQVECSSKLKSVSAPYPLGQPTNRVGIPQHPGIACGSNAQAFEPFGINAGAIFHDFHHSERDQLLFDTDGPATLTHSGDVWTIDAPMRPTPRPWETRMRHSTCFEIDGIASLSR